MAKTAKIEPFAGGDMAFVALKYIVQHPEIKKSQRQLDDETVQSLTKDISRNGLLQPLLVWNGGGDGTLMEIGSGEEAPSSFLVDGNHRLAALKAIFKSDGALFKERFPNGVPVYVVSGELKDALAAQVRANVQRKDPEAGEIFPVIERLMSKEFGMRQKDVAKAIGKSEAYVSNILSIKETLGEEGAEEVKKGGMRLSDAKSAAREVRKAKKEGKSVNVKEVLEKAKNKKAKLASKGRERSERRVSAAKVYERYKALPRMQVGQKVLLLEATLAYLAGEENTELPEELQAETGSSTKED